MSEQTQISDFSQIVEQPESMKETFIAPEFSSNPAEMIHLAVSGIIEELMNCEDLFKDKDLTYRPSSTPKEKESSCSLSQSSLDEDRVSIATSVWSSPDSDISERISRDVQSEEIRRESEDLTGIKKMSDISQTDEEADELMECDDLLEDESLDLGLNLSFLNEECSRTLSWGSLSWDSRTTCYWSDRPSSSASSSSANSAMSKVTEEDAGTLTGSVASVEEQEVHPEVTEDKIQAPNFGRSAKKTEQGDPAPASSKTTISTRGKFFRWMKKNKIHPLEVDVSTGESIKRSDCPPETCSSIEEETGEVSAETKMKKGSGFTRFFRSIFSKNEKKPKQDKMENRQKKAGIKVPVEEQEVIPEDTEEKIQTSNFGRSSPSALQEDKIPSPQSQTKAGSVIQIEVKSFSTRTSDDEHTSHQEEAEAGEAKQTEQIDSVIPASSKTTISTRGNFFKLKNNKIHPLELDVSTGESIKSSDCPPETSNGFTRFFRSIFSKNKKKLKQEKTCAEHRVTLSPFSRFGAVR